MDRSWLWDRKISLGDVKSIFKNESHPRFVEFAGLVLARNNIPREVFKEYIAPLVFCRNWQRIKKRMRRDNWNNPRIEFWQAIYENLWKKYKQKNINFQPIKIDSQPKNGLSYKIAQNIINMRKQKGLTQKNLAKKLKISQQMISRIEKGRQNLSIATLKKIADSLGCKVDVELVNKE